MRVTKYWNVLPREVMEAPFLGDLQKPSGHGPEQPALGDPAQAGGLDQMTS